MEKVSYEITSHLANLAQTYLIANRKGKKNLPFFLPYALFRALFLIKKHSIDIVHLSDGMLAPVGSIIKSVCRIPVVSTIHGLDVTYHPRLYQRVVPASLNKLDRLICISHHTKSECLNRGIEKCEVIPNGINPDEFYSSIPGAKEKLQAQIKIDLAGKRLLLSVGHLVARKGFPWFIREIIPKLGRDTVYLIIGGYGNASKGNEIQVYSRLIKELQLERQVYLLGNVSSEILKLAYNSADLLIMPNVRVENDMEGFGIVALEASSCGLPVVASNLEGIKDAVINNENGFLVEPKDAAGYLQKILDYKEDVEFKRKVREYTTQNFCWDKIAAKYLEIFQSLTV
jgi:glycosyltransferase involved in cell wall biosynthesis